MSRRWAIGILLAGLGVSALGDQVYLVALNVWVLGRTHSSVAVAGLWMAPPLAGLIVGSGMGSLADRWDRRLSLIVANLFSAVFIGIIPLLQHMVPIYIAIFLVASANGLFTASLASYVKLLVPRPHWARINAVRGMLTYGSLVLGPAVAGVLLIRGQPGIAIWLDATTFLLSAGALALLPRLNPVHEGSDAEGTRRMASQWSHDLQMVRDFLQSHRVVLGVMAGFFAMVVFGSAADAQEVVFTRRVLGLSQSGYGYLVSAAGSGYVVGALLTYLVGSRLSVRVALGVGVALSATSYLFYARSTTFETAALALVLLGIFQSIANVGFSVYLQESLPTTMIGRIIGTVQAAQNGLIVVAVLVGGFLAHTSGVRFMMTSASVAALAAGLWLTALCLGPGAATRFVSPEVARRVSS